MDVAEARLCGAVYLAGVTLNKATEGYKRFLQIGNKIGIHYR